MKGDELIVNGIFLGTKRQLNKANSSDTIAPFFYLNSSITNGTVSSKIYDKRDDFNF